MYVGSIKKTSRCNQIYTFVSKVVKISAWKSSLYIEFEFHQVSNCRVPACIKLDFCLSISSFGSSDTSFSGFYGFFSYNFSKYLHPFFFFVVSVFCTELWQKLVLVAKVEKFWGMAPPIASTAVHPQQQQITQPLFRKVLLSTRVETNLNRTRKWFEMLIDCRCLRFLSSKDKMIFCSKSRKCFCMVSTLLSSKASILSLFYKSLLFGRKNGFFLAFTVNTFLLWRQIFTNKNQHYWKWNKMKIRVVRLRLLF